MLYRIGLMLVFLSSAFADSECLWFPVGIAAFGILLMQIGKRGLRNEN